MNDDFEQRLRTLLLTDTDPPASEPFDALVRTRISRLRGVRQFKLAATAVAATGIGAVFVAPLLASGASFVAESSIALNSALGTLIASPAGYAFGALTAAAALVDALTQ